MIYDILVNFLPSYSCFSYLSLNLSVYSLLARLLELPVRGRVGATEEAQRLPGPLL